MALKRTVVPFYGKLNARIDGLANKALNSGDKELAQALWNRSKELYNKRKTAKK